MRINFFWEFFHWNAKIILQIALTAIIASFKKQVKSFSDLKLGLKIPL
jgi:hypothetical protein